MRRSAAGAALITAVGFSALSLTPATAAVLPFPDCDAAAAAGIHNIPADSPAYAPALDSDSDGIGCESPIHAYDAAKVAQIVATDEQVAQLPPHTGIISGPGGTGVDQSTGGGTNAGMNVDSGVAAPPADGTAATVVAGGLVLAAAGGGLLLRRRARSA